MLGIKQQEPYRCQQELKGQGLLSRMYLRLHLQSFASLTPIAWRVAYHPLRDPIETWSAPLLRTFGKCA